MKTSIRITLIYLACGLLWILLSDRFLYYILNFKGEELVLIQTYKGVFYIAITAILLYYTVETFYKKLASRLEKLKTANNALEESEQRYLSLFRLSPLPLWVYDINTLRFLAVNDAALKQYGYTREEFLKMTIKDIRPEEEIPKLMESVAQSNTETKFIFLGEFIHRKKNGELVTVEIRSNHMQYKGVEAKLILVNDITERINYINEIEQKNKKMQEIAWMQSHVVRAPLATMMGFVHLLEDCNIANDEKREIHKNILHSATELDSVIKQISEKANEVIK